MPIRVQCMCGELIDARERLEGREVRCPRCNRLVLVPGATRQVPASTVFGVTVVAGILVTLGILLLPGWLDDLRSSRGAQQDVCKTNLEALGRAIYAYAAANDGWMPSSWSNTFAAIQGYLAADERSGGAVWRCPADRNAGTDLRNHCSYAVNADETDGNDDDHNQFHPDGPFLQATMGKDEDLYPGPFAHRTRNSGAREAAVRLRDVRPGTILLVENWSPWNTLDLDSPQKAMRTVGPRGRASIALSQYRIWRAPKFDSTHHLIDGGTFLFLKPYELGELHGGRGVAAQEMYHQGLVHVLRAGGAAGQVELMSIDSLIQPPPKGMAPANPTQGLLVPWSRFIGGAGK